MFNLYTNEHRNGFIGLAVAKAKTISYGRKTENGKIISTFELLGLLVLFVIASVSQYQTDIKQRNHAEMTTYTSVV